MQALFTSKLFFRPRSSSVVAPFHLRHLNFRMHFPPMVRRIDSLRFPAAWSCSLSNDICKQLAPPMQVVAYTVMSRAHPRHRIASKKIVKPTCTCLCTFWLTDMIAVHPVQLKDYSKELELTSSASHLITKTSRSSLADCLCDIKDDQYPYNWRELR